jgi:subtilase family serine protease
VFLTMTDRRLQKGYLVTGLQPLRAYNVAMGLSEKQQSDDSCSARRTANPRRGDVRFCRVVLLAVAFSCLSLLAAVCGGGPSGPGVASAGQTTTTTGLSTQSGGSANPEKALLAYVACIRTHGEPNIPNPTISGGKVHISANPSSGFNPNTPQYNVANNACKHLLPKEGSGTAPAASNPPRGPAADCLTVSQCYAPRQFLAAYGIQPLLNRGITGRGVTVVLPEESETGQARPQPIAHIGQSVTDIRKDLSDFDRRFGLPAAHIQVITALAGLSASPWLAGVEEVEDTELVHAVAPDATIRELMVNPANVSTPAKLATTFAAYVRTAVSKGEVMSQSGIGQDFNVGESSWTSTEVATMNSALEFAAARNVTVVVASGDYGAIGNGSSTPRKEVSLPASDPWALAAGGTTLTANPGTGAYQSETAWNVQSGSPDGSGGGFSRLFARPSYQSGVSGIGANRGVPDVAGEATGTSGMALAFSAPGGGEVLIGAGGTSAAAPFWAGLIALADQAAGHPLGFVNPAIYRIAQNPQYHGAFHDITTGNNTVALNGATVTGYQAGPGWDPVTGWGSPDAQVLIPLLARSAGQ